MPNVGDKILYVGVDMQEHEAMYRGTVDGRVVLVAGGLQFSLDADSFVWRLAKLGEKS